MEVRETSSATAPETIPVPVAVAPADVGIATIDAETTTVVPETTPKTIQPQVVPRWSRGPLDYPDPFAGEHDECALCGDEEAVIEDTLPYQPQVDAPMEEQVVLKTESEQADEAESSSMCCGWGSL
jgi:hypothetical protein